jgi:hypothetical protein
MSINVSSRESRRIDLDQFDFGEIDKLDPSLSSDNQTVGITLKIHRETLYSSENSIIILPTESVSFIFTSGCFYLIKF